MRISSTICDRCKTNQKLGRYFCIDCMGELSEEIAQKAIDNSEVRLANTDKIINSTVPFGWHPSLQISNTNEATSTNCIVCQEEYLSDTKLVKRPTGSCEVEEKLHCLECCAKLHRSNKGKIVRWHTPKKEETSNDISKTLFQIGFVELVRSMFGIIHTRPLEWSCITMNNQN